MLKTIEGLVFCNSTLELIVSPLIGLELYFGIVGGNKQLALAGNA